MNKTHKYYLAEGYGVELYNAAIVRNDNEKILDKEGFKALKFKHTKEGSAIVKIARLINAFQIASTIKQNSLVLFHFPLLANIYKLLLCFLKWRGIKTVALIIDIDGIRDRDEMLLKKEMKQLQQFTYLIAHNPAMKKKLLGYLPASKIFSIDLFDYPSTGNTMPRQLSTTICFAGNFAKAKFVNDLYKMEGVNFNLYGSGIDKKLVENNISYKGIFSPHGLPQKLEGSFGLVWDGSSIETCDDYLLYNNPHKLSLYLAAGLPVIAWQQSATATFIEENKLGILINSLHEIKEKINGMLPGEYELMRQNTQRVGVQIREGYFLKKIISAILYK